MRDLILLFVHVVTVLIRTEEVLPRSAIVYRAKSGTR